MIVQGQADAALDHTLAWARPLPLLAVGACVYVVFLRIGPKGGWLGVLRVLHGGASR